MRIEKVEEILEKSDAERTPRLCEDCSGKGWRWSQIEFGDLPSDKKKRTCSLCAGTGRVVTLSVRCSVTAPFDFSAGKANGFV
jgi:DnaJ-class molecular chaperone